MPVSGLTNVVALTAGAFHTCALRADGQPFCWGDNLQGQLGNGTNLDQSTPVPVLNLSNVAALAVGGSHTCALRASGRAICWGNNSRGQMGDGTTLSRTFPLLAVLTLTNVAALTAGDSHTCALRADGQPFCWGGNDQFQVGNGTTLDQPTPVAVPSFSFNVAPGAELRRQGGVALVTALAHCRAGQTVKIRVSLTQGETVGVGRTVAACTGALAQYPVRVRVQGPHDFTPGPAQAEATARIRGQSMVDTQEWTRAVTLQSH